MADSQKLAKALQSTISNQPRSNRMLGMIADALKPVQQYASKVNIPIVDENLADFTGLTGTQSLAEDMSYGKPLFSGGSLQTAQVDPRIMDAAGFAPTAGAAIKPVAKSYGKMLAKELGRQINDGTTFGKIIDPRMNVVNDEDLQNKAIQHFKLTQRPSETGYILDNGKRLDFSGRYQSPSDYEVIGGQYFSKQGKPDHFKNERSVDHRTVHEIMPDQNYGWDALSDFIDKTGAVRYLQDVGASFVDTNKPSDIQLKTLVDDFRKSGNTLTIDIDKKTNGQNLHSVDFENPTFEEVKKFIDKVYK